MGYKNWIDYIRPEPVQLPLDDSMDAPPEPPGNYFM